MSSEHSLISHQAGAAFLTLSDQMIEFTPWMMLIKDTQIAKTVTATFQDPDRIDVEKRGRRTRTLARKFTIGTRGYNGSMV